MQKHLALILREQCGDSFYEKLPTSFARTGAGIISNPHKSGDYLTYVEVLLQKFTKTFYSENCPVTTIYSTCVCICVRVCSASPLSLLFIYETSAQFGRAALKAMFFVV